MEKFRQITYRILRWSEKYTKTDMVYLTKGGFWVTSSQASVSLMAFLMAIAFARLASKEAYGEYKYLLSAAGILSTLTLSGVGTVVTQSVTRGYEGTMNYMFWKNIRWSVLFFLGALGLAIYYVAQGNSHLGIAMLTAGCLSPVLASTNLYNSFLTAKKDFKRSAIYYNFLGNIFPYACLFTTLLLTKNPLWLVITYFVSNTLIGVILYLRIIKIYQPNKQIDTSSLTYSKHLSLMNILGGVASNIDQILVFHYIGAAELAIYNFATAIPNQAKALLAGLDNLIFPKFTGRNDKEIVAGMKNKILLLSLAGLIASLAYFFLAPFIFRIFFPQYLGSVFYSQIFGFTFLMMAATPPGLYLSTKKKVRELYLSNVFISIFQIIIVFASIAWYGLMGLIIARVILRFVGGFTTFLLYRRASTRELGKP